MGLGEAEKAALDEVLAGRNLIELITPQRRRCSMNFDETRPHARSSMAIRQRNMVADYEAGMPVRAIGAKYGVRRSTISALVRHAGAVVRSAGLSDEERERASALYEGGMTLKQVAQLVGVGGEAVRRAVLDGGGTIRTRGRSSRTSVDSLD